jgi:NADH dehydrogenase
MPHLLIIGGTGVLGNAAAIHFLEKGFHVTVFVRNKDKAIALEKKGATVITGDLTDTATINGIFNGIDIVLTAAHGMLGKGKNKSAKVDEAGHQHLIDEAKQAGIRHFIYTSVFSASPNHPVDFFRTKYLIEQYLINSGLNYTILRLPAFMEWHAYNLLGKKIVEKGKTIILGAGKNPVNFIAVKDVIVAIDTVALNQNYYSKIINVAGPQNISRNEIAELFGKALNIKPKTGHVPVGVLKVFSVLFKPFHPGIARIMKFSVHTETSDETMTTKDSIEQFGLKPTTMEEFIQSVVEKK